MRRITLIFAGLLMLIAMLGLLFFSGAIYDAENKYNVEAFFFETNPRASQRIQAPVSVNDIPDKVLRDMIIERFVNEYFYVIPYEQNAVNRQELKNADGKKTALRGLSRPKVYETWQETVAPEIVDLAEQKVLRTVQVSSITESESGHLIVEYVLKTWDEPNNPLVGPQISTGSLYLEVTKNPIRVEQTEEALKRLQRGEDPVSAFTFKILGVVQN